MEIKTKQFKTVAKKEIGNPNSRGILSYMLGASGSTRESAMDSFPDPKAAQQLGGIIRAESVARLPELLEQFEANAIKSGTNVFWAEDSRKANEYILNLANKNRVKYVTKGKSMVTEEMALNDFLINNGIDAIETDLGEFIIQLLNQPPFHIVAPALNVPIESIRDLFMENIGMEEPTIDPVELGYAARIYLREKFYNTPMGITGINFAVAETGTIINVENEGNIRLNKSSPGIQVSVMTIEKVLPSLTDAMHLIRLVAKCGTGQHIGAYISMDTGPKKNDDIDGPEELHIIILDNGRSRLYKDRQAREILQCIRCGGCLSICPVYSIIGGYPYGWVYSGPIGQLMAPLLLGLSNCHDHIWACTGCGACKAHCPAGIDHPRMLQYLRNLESRGDLSLKSLPLLKENMIYRAFSRVASNPILWRMSSKVVRTILNRGAKDGKLTKGPGPLSQWFEGKDFPEIPAKTFHDRWSELKKRD